MLLATKVSKSHFNFVYVPKDQTSVCFGQVPRNTKLSEIPLFKRVPQECLLYLLKDQNEPPHPKHIVQYSTWLASEEPAAIDFACLQIAHLFQEFSQCLTNVQLIEQLIGSLNQDDYGYSSSELNALRLVSFCLRFEENIVLISSYREKFEELVNLSIEEYQERLTSLAKKRNQRAEYEHEFWLFRRFTALNSEKLIVLLEICAELKILNVDIVQLVRRQRLEPSLLESALDFSIEMSYATELPLSLLTWLFDILEHGDFKSRVLATKALLNELIHTDEGFEAHTDAFLRLGDNAYTEIQHFLGATEVDATHDYVYALDDSEQQHLYQLLKDFELAVSACYSLHLTFSCSAVQDVVVMTQQITQNLAIYLLSRRFELEKYDNLHRFTEIIRRFYARIKNQHFAALIHALTRETDGVSPEARAACYSASEIICNSTELILFIKQNYARDDDVSTLCIDLIAKIAPGDSLAREIQAFWWAEGSLLADFNRSRLKALEEELSQAERSLEDRTPDVLSGANAPSGEKSRVE